MDFPKSVEGIGLVGDRFIDENPVTGQQGSLIAAKWGNQVTDEILSVMDAAKKVSDTPELLEPSEDKSDQLLTAIQALITDSMPESLSGWGDIKDKPVAIGALANINKFNISTNLTNEQLGLILIDASLNDVVLTLPESNEINKLTRVTVYRIDNSAQKVMIKSATGEVIYFNTQFNSGGYGFFYLMGAGDYWTIVGDGLKGWYKVDALDKTPLLSIVPVAGSFVPPGGYMPLIGSYLDRTKYPWLFDAAVASTNFINESSVTLSEDHSGFFTNGDGINTFRLPDGRTKFIRMVPDLALSSVGVYQADNLQGHGHVILSGTNDTTGWHTQGYGGVGHIGFGGSNRWGDRTNEIQTDKKNGTPRVGSETRPKNIAYPFYIKII